MVTGVTEGFSKNLEINGVGYRAAKEGKNLVMAGRRTCPNCGASFHIASNPPKTDGVCDNCGAALTIRKDDSPETVKARLETYHKETEPLKAFYEARGKLRSVDNQPSIEATTAVIRTTLGI